jgi:hypothetical protein
VGLFVAVTFVIVSFYGGGFATVPAYLKDLFGGLEVGAIHGRLLTAWSAAGVAGPLIVNAFVDARSARGIEGAALYLPSLVTMVCVLLVGLVANLLIRAVDARHEEPGRIAAPQERELAAGSSPGARPVTPPMPVGPAGTRAGREQVDVVVLDRPIADDVAPALDPPATARGSAARTAAIGLWVVVTVLLAYGVLQTAIKAAALVA